MLVLSLPVGGGISTGCGFNIFCMFFAQNSNQCTDDIIYSFTVTPQIQFTADPNPVSVNGDLLLRCIITAEPFANFSEIVRITSDGAEEVVANMSNPTGEREFQVTYLFMNVRFPWDDGARFECRSSNANGPEAVPVTIIVQGEIYYRIITIV